MYVTIVYVTIVYVIIVYVRENPSRALLNNIL